MSKNQISKPLASRLVVDLGGLGRYDSFFKNLG